MPLIPTNGVSSTGVSNRAVIRRNETHNVNLPVGIVGLAGENITATNAASAAKKVPYATGMTIGANYTGFYLYSEAVGSPLKKVLVFNPGPTAIIAGYNVASSGGWTSQTGFPLASGDHIEFGGTDTTPVINCWAKTSAQTNQVVHIQGFNQEFWI